MTSKPYRQLRPLVNAALVTSPVIATLLITPTFLVSEMSAMPLERVLIVSSVNVLFVWGLHLLLLKLFPAFGWQRLALAAAVGFLMVAIESRAMQETAPLLQSRFYLIRCINILSINCIVFMISNYILLSQTKKQLDMENDQLKFNNLEARFQVLKNQINPHFLFNSIGTAKALIRKDPQLADEYLVKLSSILRLGFDHKSDTVTVKEELGFCKDYAQLQQIRFGQALRFDAAIEEKYLNYVLPCFSLLTLVENAVKHNALTEEDPLVIGVTNKGDLLIAENNIHPTFVLDYSSGTGLKNLSERYRLLFDAPVKIETEAALFRVTLKMIPA